MEKLVEIGVAVQQLLQAGTAVGTGVIDDKACGRKGISPHIACDHHPMLTTRVVFYPQQHRFALAQQNVNAQEDLQMVRMLDSPSLIHTDLSAEDKSFITAVAGVQTQPTLKC